MHQHSRIRVGITMGDPAGIGPAIIAKALPQIRRLAEYAVIGDKWAFKQLSGVRLNTGGIRFIDRNGTIPRDFAFGRVCAACGKASIEYLDQAMELLQTGEIDCLITCPISKQALVLAGYSYSGHTEYFSIRVGSRTDMMLLNKNLRFVLATRHIALRDVAGELSQDAIVECTRRAYAHLQRFFLISNPRIAVCGLNPHASDNGLMGDEESRIISPAVEIARQTLHSVEGPLPADIAIVRAKQKKYDCVIAMYHDQALIPLKLSDLRSGVNITLGLPFVRTSPLHGTAFDIAHIPRLADPGSLIEAVKLAIRCTLNLKKA